MTKICIFDLDGTLARTQASIARPVNMTLAYYGLPEQPVEAFNYFAGDGIKNALKRALIAAGDEGASHLEEGLPMCRAWMQEDPVYLVEPYDHMVDSLHELKDRGIIITVLSNKPHLSAVNVVETIFGKGCSIISRDRLIPFLSSRIRPECMRSWISSASARMSACISAIPIQTCVPRTTRA